MLLFGLGRKKTVSLAEKYKRPNVSYGDKRRIPVFTYEKIPDFAKRARENEKIAKLIDYIGELYGNFNTPPMTQILIYSDHCPACKQSFPLWINLTSELKRVLPTYDAFEIEFDKEVKIGEVYLTGEMIYRWVKASGVPFVIQNFEIVVRRLKNSREYRAVKRSPWYKSYDGALSPYGFLSEIFKVENLFIESIANRGMGF